MARKRRLLTQETHSAAKHEETGWISSAKAFFSAHEQVITLSFTILLLLIPIILSITFRAPTAWLPVADDWAASSVQQNIRNSIANNINQQFPNLPSSNKQQLVAEQYAELMKDPAMKEQYDLAVNSTAAYFRSQLEDENGHTYMPDLDTYQHLRYIENIIDHGFAGDKKLADGTMIDDHKFAPFGVQVKNEFYTSFSAWVYRLVSFFNPSTLPMYVFFWMPVLFAALAVIPAFFIGRREGLLAGFFAAMLIAVHPSVIGRTAAGFADTDILVVFFPILIAWFFLEMFEAKGWARFSVFLGLTGFCFGLFSWAWSYWWFFFDVFLVVLLAYVGYMVFRTAVNNHWSKLRASKEYLRWIALLVGFIVLSGFFISLFSGFSSFVNLPFSVFGATQDFKDAVNANSLWPNVLTTVAELNEPSISGIISTVGGTFLFVLALMGMLFALVPRDKLSWKDWTLLSFGLIVFLFLVSSKGLALPIFWFLVVMALPVALGGLFFLKDERNVDVKYAFFLIAWLAASIFTMTKGVRFVLLLIPPFAIGIAITIGALYFLLKRLLTEELELSKLWVAPILFLILCIPLYTIVGQGYEAGRNGVPHMTDAWWNSLAKIKQEAAPDAIINSWWDFGHWFKYVADRAVTFDGASQNTPMAHWVGHALITSDEKESLAILRMLDCGSSLGTDEIHDALPVHDDYEAIMLTKQIIMMRHADAAQLLRSKGISEETVTSILNHTHCDPPEDYFITSSDMIGKAGVWGHFGSWDFAKADAYQHFRQQPEAIAVDGMAQKYGWTKERATTIYYEMQKLLNEQAVNAWISPWPGYSTSSWSQCSPTKENPALFACPLSIGLGNQQGINTVVELFLFNSTQPNASSFVVGFYDSQGTRRSQNADVKPNQMVLFQNGTSVKILPAANTIGLAVVVDDGERPRILLVDPLHAESLFLKLYFLDGEGATAFTKFTEERDFMGNRIVVWKVDWSKLQELGLE